MNDVLSELTQVLEARKAANAEESYVSSLHEKGLNKILEKVGEEAVETILAARDLQQAPSDQNNLELIKETADLWFHSLVMLSHLNLNADDVLQELQRRFNLSGLTEKENRKNHD